MNVNTVDACLAALNARISKFELQLDRITKLLPDLISHSFSYDSSVPVAAVCLHDTIHTLGAARYALDRYCEVGQEHRERGSEAGAVFFERFYLDDVALRLYSAAEHLANAILMMNEATDADLAPYRNARSQWEKVRKYLNQQHPGLVITDAMAGLRQSRAWRLTMGYRGKWVHNQPPTVAGLGIQYRRQKRWNTTASGARALVVGSGDPPEHIIQDMAEQFIQAFADFLNVLEVVVNAYYRLLSAAGIKETSDGMQISARQRSPSG